MKWAYLALGSLTGGFARYFLAGAAYRALGTSFPYGTLVVNLSGCLFIGFLDGLAQDKFFLGPHAKMLLMIGFCGAFTTFSTLMLETDNLLRGGEALRAILNAGGSLVLGLILLRIGVALGRLI